ncbi:hypothetical protein G6672_00720 [Polynucleobacter paneuropaeus]|nr:hypothetical protein [Polynucleobacter paneuropaeus]
MALMLAYKKFQSKFRLGVWHSQALSLLIIFFFWATFISWRLLYLGFYHDDWVLLTLQYRIGEPMIIGGIYRPLNVLLNYLGVTLFGEDVQYWHGYGAILVLLCSLVIYWCVFRLNSLIGKNNSIASLSAVFASVFWMLLPCGFGYTAWPAMFPGMIAIIFFTLAIISITYQGARYQVIAGFLFFITGLTYEVFWLAFVSLWLIKLSSRVQIGWKNAIGTLVSYALIQLLLVFWNRGVNLFFNGQNKVVAKSINFDFLGILSYVPYRVLATLGVDAKNIYWLYGILISVVTIILWSAYRRSRFSLILLACILGAFTSLFIYSLAGYAVMPTGIFSRTFIAINLWFAIGFGVSFAFLYEKFSQRLRAAFLLCCVFIIGYLGYQTIKTTFYWAESWEFQTQLVKKIPFQDIEKLPNSKVGVILLLPDRRGKMESINAFWDATAMFYLKAPNLREKIESGDLFVMVSRQGEWLSEWDGKSVSQSWCSSPAQLIGSHHLNSLYAVAMDSKTLISLPKGWSYGCGSNSDTRAWQYNKTAPLQREGTKEQ